MLTVVPIKQSSIDSSYYLKQDGGYYIENKTNKELYQWFGKGAEKLGLVGNIDPSIHQSVYLGKLPNGEEIGKSFSNGLKTIRPGYDLTFSLNKDLSLIICCSDNQELSEYILHSHMNAVKTVLNEVEKYVQARVTVKGQVHYEDTKNMIASLCTHFSSRAGDPDVHTHALVANATERSDGNWRALATDMSRKQGFFEMLRDNATFFGSLYQNEMAVAAKQAGFQIEPTYKHGMFKICGFPDDIRDHFSKRRKQIESIVNNLGDDIKIDKKLYDQIAQHSKSAKEKIDTKEFFTKSKMSMDEFLKDKKSALSFDKILLNGCNSNFKSKNITSIDFDKKILDLVKDSVDEQSQFNMCVNENQVIAKAISFSVGEAPYSMLRKGFTDLINSKYLISVDGGYVTQDSINRAQILRNAIFNTLPSGLRAQKYIPHDQAKFTKNLSESLNESRLCVISEPKSINGKDALINDLVSTLRNDGQEIKILASNKLMSSNYNDNVNKKHGSLWQRLKRIGHNDLSQSVYSFLYHYERDLKSPLDNLISKKNREVFIVDDAKKLSFDVIHRLVTLTEKRQSRLIFLSNPDGRENIFTGNPLKIIQEVGINQIDVRKVYKNFDKKMRANITAEQVNISGKKTSQKQVERQLQSAKYAAAQLASNKHVQVVSASKYSAEKLNQLIRSELVRNGSVESTKDIITTSIPIYINQKSQKYAKSYPQDAFIKEYVGRGQFHIRKIVRHDLEDNKVIVQNSRGKSTAISVTKLAKKVNSNEVQIYREKQINIATGDLL